MGRLEQATEGVNEGRVPELLPYGKTDGWMLYSGSRSGAHPPCVPVI